MARRAAEVHVPHRYASPLVASESQRPTLRRAFRPFPRGLTMLTSPCSTSNSALSARNCVSTQAHLMAPLVLDLTGTAIWRYAAISVHSNPPNLQNVCRPFAFLLRISTARHEPCPELIQVRFRTDTTSMIWRIGKCRCLKGLISSCQNVKVLHPGLLLASSPILDLPGDHIPIRFMHGRSDAMVMRCSMRDRCARAEGRRFSSVIALWARKSLPANSVRSKQNKKRNCIPCWL